MPQPSAGDWSDLEVLVIHRTMAGPLTSALQATPGLRLRIRGSIEANGGSAADALIGWDFGGADPCEVAGLRWLHLTGSGVDHLSGLGSNSSFLITTSGRVPVTAVAEYAIAGLLLLAKDLPELVRGQRHDWFTSTATLISGSCVAVVGAGRIGRMVLTRLTSLGARTLAVTRHGTPPVEGATRTIGISRLTAEAPGIDHLIACLPGGPGTKALVGKNVLSRLPRHATVVNVGRAATVDTQALYALLRDGRLRGAFLDVHEIEPLPAEDEGWSVPGLVISPHRAFGFPDEATEVAAVFLDNLDDLRNGRAPRDLVHRP